MKLTITLLGIDGSGKSTASKELKKWFEEKGYKCEIIPFHYWVFADKLKLKTGKIVDHDRKRIDRPHTPKKGSISAFIKPLIALIDNIIFYIKTQPDGKSVNVVIFDRFICATQIKFKALNYHVDWLGFIWKNFHTDIGFIFDVNEEISIQRQKNRNDPYLYTKEQLSIERKEYLKYGKKHEFKIIDNNSSKKEDTFLKILKELRGEGIL